MLHITPQGELEEYFASTAKNQSKLKKLLKGIAHYHDEDEEFFNKPYFLIGSGVDCLLTGEEGAFERSFAVCGSKMPSEAITKIIQAVHFKLLEDYQEYLETVHSDMKVKGAWDVGNDQAITAEHDNLLEAVDATPFTAFAGILGKLDEDGKTWMSQHEAYILDAVDSYVDPKTGKVGYQGNWGAQAKLKAIISEGQSYFDELCKSYGKKLLGPEQMDIIKAVVNSLKDHPRTASYFNREVQSSIENFDIYYQFPIYFELRGKQCKALLDLLIVGRDENGRIISVLPIDIKTMEGNTYEFIRKVKSFRYDIQAAWYSEACVQYFALERNTDVLRNFMFIVESTTQPGKPLVFEADSTLLHVGRYGVPALVIADTGAMFMPGQSPTHIMREEIKGFEQLLNLEDFHDAHGWNEEKEILEANGQPLVISWDGFINNN